MDELLKQLAAQVEKLGTAAWDQAPLIFRDIIVAGIVSGVLGLVSGLLMIYLSARGFKIANFWYDDDDDRFMPLYVGAVLAVAIGGLLVADSARTLLTAWLAPRAYLIDYLR